MKGKNEGKENSLTVLIAVRTELGRYVKPSDQAAVMPRVMATPNFEPLVRKTLQQGCATTLRAALDTDLEGKRYIPIHPNL
jgi:hypothetical protein